jgi:hypothetical protein
MVNFEEKQPFFYEKSRERSKEQREFAERFDSGRFFHGTEEGLDLVLVSEGVKPAASATLWKDTQGSEDDFQAQIDETVPTLMARGLPCDLERGSMEGRSGTPIEYAIFYIGRSNEELQRLSDASEIKDLDERRRALGAAYGYPETALSVKPEERMQWYDFPDDMVFRKELHLPTFFMSKEHWPEEIQTVKEWAKVAKEACPNLYEWVTSERLLYHFTYARQQNPERIRTLLQSKTAMSTLEQSDKPLYDKIISQARANNLC